MDAILRGFRALARHWVAVLVLLLPGLAALPAQAQADPPARVATLTAKQGAVAWAPAGESEWLDATRNRPLTRGDRLWVDAGGRAELHAGSAALQLDGRSLLDLTDIDAGVVQATLDQGSAMARVRQLGADDSFEIDTPQLAVRAAVPGEFRIDVDLALQITRVSVRSGVVTAYGANGASRELAAGDQLAFTGRDLTLALGVAALLEDDFERWAAAHNRDEDRSIAARYVPRTVVGYAQLDHYGRWAQDSTWGPVWYPAVTVVDWAPYRYGHWEWIAPWGWTWIDDAPWGFAPFHYGRWVQLGPRWAWVPGRLGPRPVYAPALVGFIGGGGWSLTLRSGPGIGWYPLAPWEPWRPWYRTSTVYVQQVNQVVVLRREPPHFHRPPGWFSAMPLHEFETGRPVPVRPAGLDRRALLQAPPAPPPVVADGRRFALETQQRAPLRAPPPPAQALPPPVAVHPVPAPLPRRFVPAVPGAGIAVPAAGLPPQPAGRATVPGAGMPPGTPRDAQAAQQALRQQQEQQRAQQRAEHDRQAQQEAQRAQQAQQRAAQREGQRQPQAQPGPQEDPQRAAQRDSQRQQQEQQRAQQEQQRAAQQQAAAVRNAQREQALRLQQQERAAREQQRQQAEQQRAVQQQQRAQQEAQRLQREQQRAVQEQQRAIQAQQPPQQPQAPQREQVRPGQPERDVHKQIPRPVPRRDEPGARPDDGGRRP
ncbi:MULTISPECIES: DUF6600 domain-containing protein [Ramlibacter]|uniref:RING-type E3 ubiquitin transferase n=1 Tax=Ramlibacter aquaticus TaxID=2780094 RepID=A0ABR9SBN0_9BURK|nr:MULTISPECIES: DUF6600 domain-containing protein [Ramlibacter]MBE7939487.1 chromosome partitioning protein ParA [Ramlibacter aquaticus]